MSEVGPGQVLFQFVRHWSRRADEQGRLVLVTEAVDAIAHRGVAATVNAVAHEIGIDQSGASRLVKSASDAGYLTMGTSAADGRVRQAFVTPGGQAVLTAAREWQEEIFGRLTAGWTERQRRDFERSMLSLLARSHALPPG